MRSRNRFVIFAGDAEWRVVDGDEADDIAPTVAALPADASPEDAAAAVVTALREAIPAGATVTLALPSHWCLCARVDVADLPRSSRRQAMLYRLEEQLPLAAEEFVADFVAGGANEQSLGVAARTVVWSSIASAPPPSWPRRRISRRRACPRGTGCCSHTTDASSSS